MLESIEQEPGVGLFEKAKTVLITENVVSISLLQRKLKLGYGAALQLVAQLQEDGVVTDLNAAGFRTLSDRYRIPASRHEAWDQKRKYAQNILETALFFRDMHEERQGGHTGAINLLKPVSVGAMTLRKFVLDGLYRDQNATLTQAALHLAQWCESHSDSAWKCIDIEESLITLCAPFERRTGFIADQEQIVDRSFVRLARYLRRMLTEEVSRHTRVFDFFVPIGLVPRGFGRNGGGHVEHVIPCKYLRDASLDLFRKNWSIEEVARFIRHYLVVVEITPAERDLLDRSTNNNGLGLKDRMPDGWQFESGCIFERLHLAGIAFDPPLGWPTCLH